MRTVLDAAKVIADHYGLEPGDTLTVTVNASGSPSVAYTRRLTSERIDSEYSRETPWRQWVGPAENKQ